MSASNVQQEFEDLIGDGRWWERRPFVFDDQHVRGCVTNTSRAVEQLKFLYDADTCVRLVRTSPARRIVPLFLGGGFISEFDEHLQLGADLAECPFWISSPKLVGALRSDDGFEGARFEVGVWAGLIRAGLLPDVEPAESKCAKRPDFVVSVDGLRVAIELKGLADPARERNLEALRWSIARCLTNRFQGRWPFDFTFYLSDEVQQQLEDHVDAFRANSLPRLQAEFEAHQDQLKPNVRLTLPTLGTLVLAYRPWSNVPTETGSMDFVAADLDDDALMSRALWKIKNASKQLGAVEADLRVAVVWGSRDFLPAPWAARNAAAIFQRDPESWRVSADWAVFYNAHTLGKTPGLTIEIESTPLPNARAALPPKIVEALRGWSLRRRAS